MIDGIAARQGIVRMTAMLLATVACAGGAARASAQVQAPGGPVQTTDTTAPPAAALADQSSDSDRIQDVTVVARKRAESAQQVPIPITVIGPAGTGASEPGQLSPISRPNCLPFRCI